MRITFAKKSMDYEVVLLDQSKADSMTFLPR